MAHTKTEAAVKAIDLVKTALQSGSIKLNGSHVSGNNASIHATNDATYLKKLIDDLTAHIQTI